MTEEKIVTESGRSFKFKYLLDIFGILVFSIGWLILCEAVLVKKLGVPVLIGFVMIPSGVMLFTWWLVRLRGERWKHFGLKRPESIGNTIAIVLGMTVLLWMISLTADLLGFERDFSTFNPIRTSPYLLLYAFVYVWIFAGFYEEIVFRGFIMRRFAMVFGREGKNWPWYAAIVLQGSVFGIAHMYQGVYGVILTGIAGMLFGIAFFMGKKNLWPIILAHGLYDSTRIVAFYFGLFD